MGRFAFLLLTTVCLVGCKPESPTEKQSATLKPLSSNGASAEVYSNVRYIEEAGDLLGTQIEITKTPQPAAIVAICEGFCWGGRAEDVVIRDRKLAFTLTQELNGPGGRTNQVYKFDGRFDGDKLILIQLGSLDVPDETLTRLASSVVGQTAKLACGRSVCEADR